MLKTAIALGTPFLMSWAWRSTSVALASRPHLKHARFARDNGEVGAKQQSAAHLGLTSGAISDDVVVFLAECRKLIQHLIRRFQTNRIKFRNG